MHERAGDRILKPGKVKRIGKKSIAIAPTDLSSQPAVPPPSYPPPVEKRNNLLMGVLPRQADVPNQTGSVMTRRFTVREKLRIIDKHKELQNISATCR